MSIARRHRQQILVMKETQAQETGSLNHTSQYELMLAQLLTHQRQLSQVQSMERKAATKATLLHEYTAYVEGVLAADVGIQDDVLMTIMVWRIDTGDLNGALEIAEYAIKHQLNMPTRFHRDTATFIAEEIAEAVLSSINETDFDTSPIQHVMELTEDCDMPDEVRSKLHKAMGLMLEKSNAQAAIEHLTRTLTLNPRAGVKKRLEQLQKQVAPSLPPELQRPSTLN